MLKLTGAVAGGLVAASGVAAAEDYEVIEATGQTINIGDGETFENVLFDMSTGQGVTLMARHSTNWTIRNIGFDGYNEGAGFRLGVSDAGNGESLIENLYLGDGSAKVGTFQHGPGAIFLGPEHSGHITFRNCNVQGYPNNGFYCSNGSGTVRFENCYAKNNGVANFRVAGGSSRADEIVNCVGYNDNTDYGWDGGYTEENGRPLWAWPDGPIEIEDSHFADGPYVHCLVAGASNSPSVVNMRSGAFSGSVREANGSSINISNGVGSNPDLSVPEGCPTSAVEAASGGSSGDDDGEDDDSGWDRRFVYEFVGDGEETEYYFEVEGAPIERSTFNGAEIDEDHMWISDDGTRAAGLVVDGHHAWEFDELLLDVTVEGNAEVLIDERESNLDRYPLEGASGDDWKGDMPWHDTREHTIVIDDLGNRGTTDYEFRVSGSVEESNADGAFPDDGDEIDGGFVTGSVAGWRDAYTFTGELESLVVDGDATVRLDDVEIDPDDYGEPASQVLTVVSGDEELEYAIEVDGDLEAIGYDGGDASGTSASGTLTRGVRRYRVAGDITDVTLDGTGWVYLDGEAVDPSDY